MTFNLSPRGAPVPRDAEAVRIGLERWAEQAAAQADAGLRDRAHALVQDPACRAVLEGIFAHSPYLTREMMREQGFVCAVFGDGADAAIGAVLSDLESIPADLDEAAAMQRLRVAKRRGALTVALADIAGIWDLTQVTHALSDLAEKGLEVAWRHALT